MWQSYSKRTIRFCSALFTIVILIQQVKCEPPDVCPSYCVCQLRNNLNHADCSGKRLISGNSAVSHEVQYLDLSYNDVTVLENNCFQGYSHLINITVAHNALHTIFLDVFAPLKRIRAIDLSYNRLESIDPRLFESNRKLHTLNMAGNKFMSLANEPFLYSKTLRTLNLANAQINVLLPKHYVGLPHLKEIDLARNLIITIDQFAAQAPKQLRSLNLEDNNLNCDQTLQTAMKQLKARYIEIIYSQCQQAEDAALKGANNVEKKFERMELVSDRLTEGEARARVREEDAGDSQEDLDINIRRKVLTGWHFPPSSADDEDENYYRDFDVDQNEEIDEYESHSSSQHINKTCRRWCYQNGWSTLFPQQSFNDGVDFSAKQYTDFDLLFVFICGIAIGIALTIVIGSCIICIWRCSSLKAASVQVEDPYDSLYAVVRQAPPPSSRSVVDAIRRPSAREPEPEPELEHIPAVPQQPTRRRQRRHPASQRVMVRHDQLARSGGDNFISQLFGRPARHHYYRAINENTATLIRRLSRSNLFNNRLSQHFGDRERSTTNSPPTTPDGGIVVSVPDVDTELEGLSAVTSTPHSRRPETPPPLYSDIVPKRCDESN